MSTGIEPTITLTDEGDWWTATDTETGVTSQGQTREEALENLDEALCGYRGEGEEPSEVDLRKLGIDPEKNESDSLDESEIFE